MAAEDRDAHKEHRGPHTRGLGESRQAHRGDERRDENEERLGGQQRAGEAFIVDEGRPARGAPQDLREVEPARRDERRLDVVRKRRRVAAQDEKRTDPPHAHQRAAGEPRQQRPAVIDKRHKGGRDAGRERRRRVDRAHAGNRQRRRGRRAPGARPRPVGPRKERQHDPRREHDRPRLRGNRRERRERARRERKRRGCEAGRRRGEAYAPGERERSRQAHAEHEGPPGALRDPVGEGIGKREECALGKEVAVGLVLELAQGEGVRPRVRGAGEEAGGVGGEIVLRIGRDAAPRLCEGEEGGEEPPGRMRRPGAREKLGQASCGSRIPGRRAKHHPQRPPPRTGRCLGR